jgi:hypothetical protein
MASDDNATRREVMYCDACKADREVLSVQRISADKQQITLECGHSFGKIVKFVIEKMSISEDTAWVILKNPVEEVIKAIKDNDYFKTVTYACSVLEYCGQQILIWHTKNIGNPLPVDVVRDWKLFRVINELFKYEKITDSESAKLHCIRGLRNEFVHEDFSIKLTSTMAQKIKAHHDDIIKYTAKLKEVYDELAAKAEAGSAVAD